MGRDIVSYSQGNKIRHGIGILLLNPEGLILAGRRVKGGLWQYPQGGRERGHERKEDALREMTEELGVVPGEVSFRGILPHTTMYLLPDEFRSAKCDGQLHYWAVFDYLPSGLPDLTRATDKEFDLLQWTTPEWVTGQADSFRQEPYRQVERMLAQFAPV